MANIDKLFSFEPFAKSDESDAAFFAALRDELAFHYENNAPYRRFCDRKGFSPYGEFSIEEIPPVAASVFKNMGDRLGSVSREEVRMRLQSSATSGTPSTVVVDKTTSRRQSKAMVKVVQSFIGRKARPFLVMDIDPREGFGRDLGARFAAVSGYLKFSSRTGYFLKVGRDGGFYFDVEGMREFVDGLGGEPAVLFGFTYILYANVLKEIGDKGADVRLPTGSKILHIGGWKKLESERIDKGLFNSRLSECFGVGPEDVIDVYGFTEQMGLNYPDFRDGWKRTPAYSRVIARDPATRAVLPRGEEGVLEFVTPIPHSYPGNAVLTDDLGIVMGESECDGMYGTAFKVTGRMKKAEVRGCGDILSQKLTLGGAPSDGPGRGGEFEIVFSCLPAASGGPLEQMEQLCDGLGEGQKWLARQPIDSLIGLLSSVSGKWLENPRLADLRDKGLLFASSWLDEKNLRSVAKTGLKGNAGYADGFLPCPDSDRHCMRAFPRGLACHWLAGNVQVLGVFALAQSILAKNANLLRVSSRDEGVFRRLLETFEGEEYVGADGHAVRGDDLLRTIALVSYPHDDVELGRRMSSRADVRVAWGGREAVQAVAALPSRIGSETIMFGPRLSLAAIAREALGSEGEAKSLAKRLSVDVSVFDQTGCASPHNLFVEDGGNVSADRFIEILGEEMEKAEARIPKPEVSMEQASQVHSIRGVYDFVGRVEGPESLSWTLLVDDESGLRPPVYSRVLFIHKVASIFDCLDGVTGDIQSIGLAAPPEKGARFAEMAAERGVARLPQIGRMLNFEMPWDGLFLLDRMVRWSTLGGPLR